MSQTHQEKDCLFKNRKTLSVEQIDLCKPDILATTQIPKLQKVNSNFSILQSFQDLENNPKKLELQDDISFIETLEYDQFPLTQEVQQIVNKTKKQSLKQVQSIQQQKLENNHFLSDEEQDNSNRENQFEQSNSIEQKSPKQVNDNLTKNLKQYWNKNVNKLNEIFKIREKKDKYFFAFQDYSKKTL